MPLNLEKFSVNYAEIYHTGTPLTRPQGEPCLQILYQESSLTPSVDVMTVPIGTSVGQLIGICSDWWYEDQRKSWAGATISNATLIASDIFDSIESWVERHYSNLQAISPNWYSTFHALREEWIELGVSDDEEGQDELLYEAIFPMMDELAPKGHYFGSHQGDGALIGFWPNPDEDDEDSEEDV